MKLHSAAMSPERMPLPCEASGESMAARVFIGMPVFNGSPYIEDALKSLAAQTFRNWRLLIADNCSTDDTADVCRRFAELDSRITFVRHEKNEGANVNFQYVLEAADTEFFMWAAHDDRHAPTFLSELVGQLNRSGPSGAVAMTSGRLHYLKEGRFVAQPVPDFARAEHAAVLINLLIAPVPALIYGLWRTTILKKLFTEPFYDFYDCALITRLLCHGYTVETLPHQTLYAAGIPGDTYAPKPVSREQGRLFEYLSFTRACLHALWNSRSISFSTKAAGTLALMDFVVRSIAHHEASHRRWLAIAMKPIDTCFCSVVRRLLRRLYPV